jgi:ureidoglycolate lyase
MRIAIEPLSPASFARYGAVLAAGAGAARAVNEGRGMRYDEAPPLDHAEFAPKPTFAIYELAPSTLPFRATMLERHPWSAQAFVPMSVERFLVVTTLADAAGGPDLGTVAAFEGRPGQIVVYMRGVWHLPLVALGGRGSFAMFMWSRTDGKPDDEFAELPAQLEIG